MDTGLGAQKRCHKKVYQCFFFRNCSVVLNRQGRIHKLINSCKSFSEVLQCQKLKIFSLVLTTMELTEVPAQANCRSPKQAPDLAMHKILFWSSIKSELKTAKIHLVIMSDSRRCSDAIHESCVFRVHFKFREILQEAKARTCVRKIFLIVTINT